MSVRPLSRPFSGTNCPKWAFFGLKMLFFLRYAHITHFFGLKQTRLNGIISSPYPKVILDAFGFPVDARLSARQAVFWHQLPKMALFWAKNASFSMLCLYNPYFGLRQTQLNGIISSPYPQVTLDAFGFLVCAPSAAWKAVF